MNEASLRHDYAPYSTIKADILRLNSVSDRHWYHQLLKEESLGDQKPSELLRRMRSLPGGMQVDDKFIKEMFLERLPADVQTLLASGSQDRTVSQLAEMADRMIEVQRFQSPSVAKIPSSSVKDNLMKQVSAMADEMASLKIQLARLTSSRLNSCCLSRSRPPTADTSETRKPVSQRIDATVFSGSSGSGHAFYVCDTATHRRFLMDTGARISVVPPTAADRRFPSPGLHFQAANCSPIPTFGSLALTLNIGLRRSFTWIFAIADAPQAILDSDFLAKFDPLVDRGRTRHLDCTDVTVFADHKPLTFALRSHYDKYNPREITHLDYISQFTTDIRHIDGTNNEVADMLSRPSLSSLQLSHGTDLCVTAAEQQRVGCPGDESVSGLQLKDVPLTTGSGTIVCDVSTPFHRPFVSALMRRAVFQTLHGLSHPGIGASQKLLAKRPLHPSNGFTHLLTCVDRYTRSAEAIPLPNVLAETIVKAFVSRWVAMFGAPSTVTSDRGAQFESALFQTLLNFLGCTRIRTTAYHPAAKRMVEHFHRQLKTALRAVENPGNSSDNLPLSLLGIRAALKSDLGCSVAELVFGTTLRLPGWMLTPNSRGADETLDSLVHRLRQFMRSLSPIPPRTPRTDSYVDKDLNNCTCVFVWCDRVRQPLESPYK
nr:unnamed protein product [Spirometra erinaceieuropaei]